MPSPLKILLIASEVEPFAKTGGLADVAGALPKALSALGHDVRLLLPKYRGVERAAGELQPVVPRVTVPMGDRVVEGSLLEGRLTPKIPVYFLKQNAYYDRPALYGLPEGDFWDNCERFIFLSRGALEALKALGWRPDLIHANDWQTGLLPVYLETLYRDDPFFSGVATLFTIHNMAYQGLFWHYDLPMTGLGWDLFTPAGIEFYGKINFLKGGLVFSDLLTTVSPTYASEIQTPEFGDGLEGVLQERSQDLFGVINGIDTELWDPATDPDLPKGFSARDLSGKAVCKAALQEEMGLPTDAGAPLFGMVTRLADQKGLDLLVQILPALLAEGQLVILGSGDERYHQLLGEAARTNSGRLGLRLRYDAHLARRIYGGVDLFLMPSRYEPCGLGQLISLRYGTLPIANRTGGLADTIKPVVPASRTGTGFLFSPYEADAFLGAVRQALQAYRDRGLWQALQQNGMAEDFSWEASAKQYIQLYRKAIKKGAA